MRKILLYMFILLCLPLSLFAFTANAATSKAADTQMLGTVKLTTVKAVDATSVELNWTDDSFSYLQDGYRIYRAGSKNGKYSLIDTVNYQYLQSYTDKNLVTGKKYYYKVCKYTDVQSPKNGAFSNVKSVTPVPRKMTFSAVSSQKNTVTLTWNAAEEKVDGYLIYRATSKNGTYEAIKRIEKRTTTSFTDKKAVYGKLYYYKMKAYTVVNGKRVYGTESDPVRNKVDISQCRAFFIKTGTISADSSEFYKYLRLKYGNYVFSKEKDFGVNYSTRWTGNGKLSQLRFNAYGKGSTLTGEYEFTVNPIDSKAYLKEVSVSNSGMKVTWEKESGAVGYRIYRKTGAGSYTAVKTISDNNTTSWTDSKANKLNTKYTYFVKAYTMNGSEYRFAEKSDAKSVTRIGTPKLSSVTNKKQGVVLKWSPVKGAKSYDILRKTGNGSWKYISNTTETQYVDRNTTVGSSYTYTVCCSDGKNERRVSYYNPSGSKVKRLVAAEGKSQGSNTVKITWNKAKAADGYAVYRATSEKGTYKKIKTIKGSDTLSFTDQKLTFAKYYYYKVRPYSVKNGKNVYGEYGTVAKVRPTIATASIQKAAATTPTTVKLTWKAVSKADGYQIYQASSQNGTYKRIKTVKGNDTVSCTVTGLKNANTYYFKIRGYRVVNDKTYYGDYSAVKSCYIDMLGYAGESYESKNKRIWGSENFEGFPSASAASKDMKTIKIKTWDIDGSGRKYTRYHYLTVHKNIAPTVEEIFKEIYNGKEKFPIKSIGGYNWRGDFSSYSQHGTGLAIDINPDENAQFDGYTGKPMVGSFWKPGENPYSIKKDGDVVRAFEKYGFGWGYWFSDPDYMHFSYYGT